MKLDSNKQESSDLKVFGVGPKDSEIKNEFPALVMKLGITKEYHYQKLALESKKVCHTLVYLTTLLHSNNTKAVKELLAVRNSSLRRKSMF